MSNRHAKRPTSKASVVNKNFICLFAVHDNIHIRCPNLTNIDPITGMRNIVARPTNVRQQLKSLNRPTNAQTVSPSRDYTYWIWFQEKDPEEVVRLDQFENSIPKSTACLSRYIEVVLAVGQQFLHIVRNFVLYHVIPDRKLGSFISRQIFWPLVI